MRLKELRIKNGLFQKDVADFLGIATNTYLGYEKELHSPTPETLCKLADYFDVSLDYLLERESAPELFSDARIPKTKFQALFESSTVRQQELVIERMNAFDDANKETDKKK